MQPPPDPFDLLVIDDEASLRRTLRTALESMGHRVTEAANSADALAALRRQRFSLAFLDLRLGQEKGLELLPELLRAAPGLHVVVITAYASLDTAIEALRKGAFDYLPKPFTPNQLRVVLDRSALVRWSTDHPMVRSVLTLRASDAVSEAADALAALGD